MMKATRKLFLVSHEMVLTQILTVKKKKKLKPCPEKSPNKLTLTSEEVFRESIPGTRTKNKPCMVTDIDPEEVGVDLGEVAHHHNLVVGLAQPHALLLSGDVLVDIALWLAQSGAVVGIVLFEEVGSKEFLEVLEHENLEEDLPQFLYAGIGQLVF